MHSEHFKQNKYNKSKDVNQNVYCTITEGSACMDIRQFLKPQEEKRGYAWDP